MEPMGAVSGCAGCACPPGAEDEDPPAWRNEHPASDNKVAKAMPVATVIIPLDMFTGVSAFPSTELGLHGKSLDRRLRLRLLLLFPLLGCLPIEGLVCLAYLLDWTDHSELPLLDPACPVAYGFYQLDAMAD